MKTYSFEITATVTKRATVDAATPEEANRKMQLLAGLFLKIGEPPVVQRLTYERTEG